MAPLEVVRVEIAVEEVVVVMRAMRVRIDGYSMFIVAVRFFD